VVTAKAAMDSDQGREIQKTYDHLIAAMAEFENKEFQTWCEQVRSRSGSGSMKSQLIRSKARRAPPLPSMLPKLFPPKLSRQVAATSDEKLNLPLIKKLEPQPGAAAAAAVRLGVNFDPDLVRLLRETKYFLLLKCEVPENALKIFQSSDQFRSQISSIELICSIYNKVRRCLKGSLSIRPDTPCWKEIRQLVSD
jgi:hypothetical protein